MRFRSSAQSGIFSPAGGATATDACDSGTSLRATAPFTGVTCFSSAAIFSRILVHCSGYCPPAIFAAASIRSRSLSIDAIAPLAEALSCALRALDSVCASPARLATGARIGPALLDDALIALSIWNAWSLNSSACACAFCANACRDAMPATRTINAIADATRDKTDPRRVTRAPALCATKLITPLSLASATAFPGSVPPSA